MALGAGRLMYEVIANLNQNMPKISKCPCCGSERLLEGKMDDSGFRVPDPVFRFLHSDSPTVPLLSKPATACLDCGTVVSQTDPLELQKKAKRWMSDEAKKQALRLE